MFYTCSAIIALSTVLTTKEMTLGLGMGHASNIEQVLAAMPHKAPTIWPPASNHENYPS